MIKILNLSKDTSNLLSYAIRCDRASVLGNPYCISVATGYTRDTVCDLYDTYFYKVVNGMEPTDAVDYNKHGGVIISSWKRPTRQRFMSELERLVSVYQKGHRLSLSCWCSPKRCHVETIVKYILSLVQ